MVDVYFCIPSYGMIEFEFLCTCGDLDYHPENLPKRKKFKDIVWRFVSHGSPVPKL